MGFSVRKWVLREGVNKYSMEIRKLKANFFFFSSNSQLKNN